MHDLESKSNPHGFRRVAALLRPHLVKVVISSSILILTSALGLVTPLAIKLILDDAVPDHNKGKLYFYVSLIVIGPLLSELLGVFQWYLSVSTGQQIVQDLRSQLYNALQSQSLKFFAEARTGDIQTRITNDVSGAQQVLTSSASGIIGNASMALFTAVAMFFVNWRLAILSMCLLPVFLILSRRVGDLRKGLLAQSQSLLSDMASYTNETLSAIGVQTTKLFGRQRYTASQFETLNQQSSTLQVKQQMITRWFSMAMTMFYAATPAAIYLYAGTLLLSPSSPISTGDLVAFTLLLGRLYSPTGQLLDINIQIRTAEAIFERIFEYIDIPLDICDSPDAVDLPAKALKGDLLFNRVFFSYDSDHDRSGEQYPHLFSNNPKPPNEISAQNSRNSTSSIRPGLQDISFEALSGQLVALVGPSGAGKTTISLLAARLYDVKAGSVSIDGYDIRQIRLECIPNIVGMVTQDSFLFHTSVRENILFGRPDASEQEMIDAARDAAMHDRIMEYPDGYDTVVGERGFRLSGGEKQRIALARILLKDPPILILDEATSSLDSTSERLIQDALERTMQGRTTLAIAHRLSTILSADLILVLDAGRIVEQGSHADLIVQKGLYSRLFHEQYRSNPSTW